MPSPTIAIVERQVLGDRLGSRGAIAGQQHDRVDAERPQLLEQTSRLGTQTIARAEDAEQFAVARHQERGLTGSVELLQRVQGARGDVDALLFHQAARADKDISRCGAGGDAGAGMGLEVEHVVELELAPIRLCDEESGERMFAALLGAGSEA
jgi:hypothetical protein